MVNVNISSPNQYCPLNKMISLPEVPEGVHSDPSGPMDYIIKDWTNMVDFSPFLPRVTTFVISYMLDCIASPSESAQFLKESICSKREQILSLYSRLLFRRRQNNVDRVIAPEMASLPLSLSRATSQIHISSGHMVVIQRRINVDATS